MANGYSPAACPSKKVQSDLLALRAGIDLNKPTLYLTKPVVCLMASIRLRAGSEPCCHAATINQSRRRPVGGGT